MSEIVHRLDVDLPDAMEIAHLARAPGISITTAADLIERYARAKASEAALDAVTKTSDRLIAVVEASHA